MIYFDNAATTNIKPQSVHYAVGNAIRQYSANPGRSGHKLSNKASQMVFDVREKVASFFGAESYENVVFTQNCTMSLNIAIRGLFEPGDHILISDLEHNSVSRVVYDMAKNGLELDIFTVEEDEDILIENIRRLLKKNTKGIVCTHGSNVFGIKLPIKRIGDLCKKNGLIFVVDAAQTAGIEDINVTECNIDCLCVAPHKGLYSPMGTGILITNNKPMPFILGGTGSLSISVVQPDFLPDKYESGTLNVPGIAGIGAGIDFIKKNKKEIIKKERMITDFIYKSLNRIPNIILYNKPFLPVLSFNITGEGSDDVAEYLSRNNVCVRAGLHCAPLAHKKFGTDKIGTVRISPAYFNNLNEAERLVYLLKHY